MKEDKYTEGPSCSQTRRFNVVGTAIIPTIVNLFNATELHTQSCLTSILLLCTFYHSNSDRRESLCSPQIRKLTMVCASAKWDAEMRGCPGCWSEEGFAVVTVGNMEEQSQQEEPKVYFTEWKPTPFHNRWKLISPIKPGQAKEEINYLMQNLLHSKSFWESSLGDPSTCG